MIAHGDRIAEMWGAGISSGKIAAELGITRSAVMGKVSRMGVIRNPTGPRINNKWSAAEVEILTEAVALGETTAATAGQLGRTIKSAQGKTTDLGLREPVVRRPRVVRVAPVVARPWTEKELTSLRDMVAEGMRPKVIGKLLGRATASVWAKTKQLGLIPATAEGPATAERLARAAENRTGTHFRTCQWIDGDVVRRPRRDGPQTVFCGTDTVGGLAYCDQHFARCYVQREERHRRIAAVAQPEEVA